MKNLIIRIRAILRAVYKLLIKQEGHLTILNPLTFMGWGMTTSSNTPWMNGGGDSLSKGFYEVDNELKGLIKANKFNLSQFSQIDVQKIHNDLTWRHFIVYWSSVYAMNNTQASQKNLAECGVCDGLTIFYAINAAKTNAENVKAYLYDAWEAMKEEKLMESEKGAAGSYSYLDMEATKNNLSVFKSDEMFFNKGYIPESFKEATNPESLAWLHIDLNSALATVDALNFFWDKLEAGGVVLFDDYGWQTETQESVQQWSIDKNGTLFHLPTGQALYIKNQ